VATCDYQRKDPEMRGIPGDVALLRERPSCGVVRNSGHAMAVMWRLK